MDPISYDEQYMMSSEKNRKDDFIAFIEEHKLLWEFTHRLADVKCHASKFDAIFFPGGHGTLHDVFQDEDSAAIATEIWKRGKPVVGVSHGVGVLLTIGRKDVKPAVTGHRMTAYSENEEGNFGTGNRLPFILSRTVETFGAKYEERDPWSAHVVVDGQFITGQNHLSGKAVVEELVKALSEFSFWERGCLFCLRTFTKAFFFFLKKNNLEL